MIYLGYPMGVGILALPSPILLIFIWRAGSLGVLAVGNLSSVPHLFGLFFSVILSQHGLKIGPQTRGEGGRGITAETPSTKDGGRKGKMVVCEHFGST